MSETRSLTETVAALSQSVAVLNARTQSLEARQTDTEAKHEARFERIMTVLDKMDVRLSKDEKRPVVDESSRPPSGPLLPTAVMMTGNSSQQQLLPAAHGVMAPLDGNSAGQGKMLRVEVPTFTGSEMEGWLFQMERYFEHNRIMPEYRLNLVTFYLGGEALRWYRQWMFTTHDQVRDWTTFASDLKQRFGPSNAEVTLAKLRHTSTVAAYIAEFESISTRTPGLTPDNILDQFSGSAAMDKDIKAAFLEEVGLTICDEDTAKKCVDYCIKYNLSVSSFISSWVDYRQTRRLHVNKSDVDEFSRQLLDILENGVQNVNEDGIENLTLTPAHHTLDKDVFCLGTTVLDDCKQSFMLLKARRYRFVIFRIEGEGRIRTVVVEKVGCHDETYEDFTNSLPLNECRYAVFDFEFTTDEKLLKRNIVFIAWLPKTDKYNSRLRYSRTELTMKRALHGIEVELQAENLDEMSLEILKARAVS